MDLKVSYLDQFESSCFNFNNYLNQFKSNCFNFNSFILVIIYNFNFVDLRGVTHTNSGISYHSVLFYCGGKGQAYAYFICLNTTVTIGIRHQEKGIVDKQPAQF